MRVETIYIQEEIPYLGDLTACIGYFDGIHRGHQRLFDEVQRHVMVDGTIPAMITFDPDPWVVLKHCDELPHLTTMDDRIRIAEHLGIECVIILHFDEMMASASVDMFHMMLHQMGIQNLICGLDFHYAGFGKGNVQTLLDQNYFKVSICEAIMDGDAKISSSQIELLLAKGQLAHANDLLGYAYSLYGVVVQGNQVGRTIGFPTANIALHEAYVIPARGVYIGCAWVLGEAYPCMINIGHNPTFNHRDAISIEAHLLNFHDDIYGCDCRLVFYQYLRDEQQFSSKEALIQQLQFDCSAVINYFDERGVDDAFESI